MDNLYTIKETHALLKISRAKLYLLIKDRRLKPVKIDKKTLFKESELSRFIDSLGIKPIEKKIGGVIEKRKKK
jgi:excisionase family DNA binding protein